MRCSDVDRTWLIQVRTFSGTSPNTGTTYRDEPVLAVVEHGEPTFAVAGAAADVDRWLWNRLQPGPVERFGDTSLIDSLVSEGLQ